MVPPNSNKEPPVRRTLRFLLAAIALSTLSQARSAAAAAGTCEPDRLQASGAVYRICMPLTWNGDLVLFAHGYVGFDEPVAIPEDQLVLPDGTSVPDLINRLGYAFATTSYSTNGLAVLQGIEDLLDLVHLFGDAHGRARRVFLVGPSEGGIVTALAVERYPEIFAGGLAACAPIGNFRKQVNYDGDFRIIFDFFFPGVIPGDPINVPPEVIDGFFDFVVPRIQEAIRQDPDAVRQLLSVTHAAVDPNDPATVEETILDLAWYAVFTSNDATLKLGGQPFDNLNRRYMGSDDDALLNQNVERASADMAALDEIRDHYQTTGRLTSPLVTLHTTGDPIIPYWHEQLYALKTLLSGSFLKRHINIKIERYGHCNFKAPETLAGFALMLFLVNRQSPSAVEAALPDAASRTVFRSIVREYGAVP
jgi:pimeloyl-ACP methyl ester carboxylesterase